MKICLINPRSADDYFRNAIEEVSFIAKMMQKGSHAAFAPLALTTIAALTHEKHELKIHDEFMEGPAENSLRENEFDVIGITTLVNQVDRTLELASYCHRHSPESCLVVGGAGTMKMTKEDLAIFDSVFYGEAEETWPQFLIDKENGRQARTYQQYSKSDMKQSPVPAWQLLENYISRYGAVSVQTTRGCPYDCDFCDVIYIYGRKQRSKSIDQVLNEIRLVQSLGAKLIMLADDNFGSNRAYSKALLQELITFNRTLQFPLGYMTQSDITISEDDELLELMADCNFIQVLIGIESVDPRSLQDINKKQNLRTDLLSAITKIQSYCIPVLGSMIIGMDSDDQQTFQKTIDFVESANLMDHACHPLMAPAGTRLWHRLQSEGRLVELGDARDKLDIITNIVPKKLSRSELIYGLEKYSSVVYDPVHFMKRAIGFIHGVKRKPDIGGKVSFSSFWKFRKIMFRTLKFYTFDVSKSHRRAFFSIMREVMSHAPYLLPKMMFIYTSYLINQKRAEVASVTAKKHIEWEEAHPDQVRRIEAEHPITPAIRENIHDISAVAYRRVIKKTADKEIVFAIVANALTDYCLRFGQEIKAFNDVHQRYVEECCDRAFAKHDNSRPHRQASSAQLPEDTPPVGFSRIILDTMDHLLR